MQGTTAIVSAVISWFHAHKRAFSWREKTDAFAVLIAEVLLRKTDAPKVQEIYDKFIAKYPSPQKLAEADLEKLEADLKPLGMYKIKSRQLKCLAERLLSDFGGRVPASREDLLKLPGVGQYIANAVLCYSYGEDAPALDTNGIRVILRVFNFRSSTARPRTDKKLWELAEKLIPPRMGRDFNLALLDFAAQVCRARNPMCSTCPLHDTCLWPYKTYRQLKPNNALGV